MDIKVTPLHASHLSLGAKMTEFGGFDMPVSYKGILEEHEAVRNNVGMFDCSHMGELLLQGKEALKFINELTTNDFTNLEIGQLQYTLILESSGGVVDDLMVYKTHEEEYLLVVNASNTDKDFEWLKKSVPNYQVTLENVSGLYGQIALQGPNAKVVLESIIPSVSELKFMHFNTYNLKGYPLIISRSGYTGEDGFEIYGSPKSILDLWSILLASEVTPCGLGARDTLRFEAGLPLYGHEINGFTSPLEAGLGFGVKLDKPFFVGQSVLKEQKASGLTRRVIGLELLERNIAREGYIVYDGGDNMVGFITTGYMIPNTAKSLANVMLDSKIKIGDKVFVEIRNKKVPAVIRNRKFYEKKYERK